MNRAFKFALAMLCLFTAVTVFAAGKDKVYSTRAEYSFTPATDVVNLVKQAQEKARKDNKLFMLVLGANWCHDSQGLAAKFSEPKLHTLLSTKFETLFIDVGYFEDLHHLVQQYGYPAYFGTPTVLVIEAQTGTLLNRASVPKWQSADSVPSAEYLRYFDNIGSIEAKDDHWATTPELTAFSKHQVARLKQGFDYLRPVWEDVVAGTGDTEKLTAISTAVWSFRVQLQKDLHALHQQVGKTPNAQIQLPDYGHLIWESLSK